MSEQDSFDKALNEINKILRILELNSGSLVGKKISEEVDSQIKELERQVDQYVKKTHAMLEELGYDEETLEKFSEAVPDNIQEGDASALKEALSLKETIKKIRTDFQKRTEGIKDQQTESKEEKSKKVEDKKLSKQEHKKKYRRLGGKKWWKPM